MSELDSLLRERTHLSEENQQIKAKYKKSLQELMHILKVNKSLKECLDSQTRTLENTLAQQLADIRRNHQQELDTYRKELEEYKSMLAEESMRSKQLQRTNREREEEIGEARLQYRTLQERVKQLQNIQNGRDNTKAQNLDSESMRRKLLGYMQTVREKEQLLDEVDNLKEKIKELNIQLIQQKQKHRSDIFSKQTQIIRSKQSQYEKLRTIESKYQLLQSQLNNYKTVEKYFQEEANSIFDEDSVYNSIREQITRINEDFNKYQLESSNLLLKKREEDAQKNRKIAQLERQVTRLRLLQEKVQQKVKESQADKVQINALRQKIKTLTVQRNQFIQKNHVMEALTIIDKHRVNSTITQRIREFETRVKLLVQQNPKDFISNHSSLQQVVVLKGYIRQLSDLLKQSKKKQEHLSKKNQQYKQRLTSLDEAYKQKISQMKSKIKNYDVLIQKLYVALEDKFKQKIPDELEKEFNTAITHYEEKIVQMSEEIIKLRAKVTQLQSSKEEHINHQLNSIQGENQTYKEIISELSIKINELEGQNDKVISMQTQVQQMEDELKEKNKLIDQLAKQINDLNNVVNDYKERESNTNQIVQNYERKVIKYKEELQQKQRISTNLSRNSIDAASLIEKINYLEYELNKSKSKAEPTPKPDDFVKGLQTKLSAQNQLLTQYKQEIDKLYAQLKSEKNEKRTNVVDQYSIISELQKQITDGQIKVLNLQNEMHNKQAQYKEELQSLRYQNRALIEQLNSKHSEMMVYFQQLNKKTLHEENASRVPDLQRYIVELQQKNHDMIERFSYQANQLNSSILALRTTNLSLRNQLQNKEDAINELKHQLFNAQLRTQKEKSITSSMINSISGPISRDTEAQRQEKEKLLMILALLSAEVQSLRMKNEELVDMYHEDLDKYRQALKQLETRQMELNSLQFSSQAHQNKDSKFESNLQLSQEQISHLSQNSTLIESQVPVQPTTIRSHEVYKEEVRSIPSSEIISNVSIGEISPLKRRGITIKKIT